MARLHLVLAVVCGLASIVLVEINGWEDTCGNSLVRCSSNGCRKNTMFF